MRKIIRFINNYSKDIIQLGLSLVVIVIAFVVYHKGIDEINIDIFITFIYVCVCTFLANVIYYWICKFTEDRRKITTDYGGLCNRYSRETLLKYYNNKNGKVEETTFPVICLDERGVNQEPYNNILNHSHSQKEYKLPHKIEENYGMLMKAHSHSFKYNNRTVRLDDFYKSGNKVILTYSNATYWDLLVTNRAMDYEWNDGSTIREMYEPGPYINTLPNSKMANHIGINGIIEIPYHGVLFVKRSNKLSIGKRTWGTGVASKLDVEYDYKKREYLTIDKIYEAIAESINRELKCMKIEGKDVALSAEDVKGSVFAFYRDLVEGGKPQFVFYYKFPCDNNDGLKCEIKKKRKTKLIRKAQKTAAIDGTKYMFITIDELKASIIDNKGIKRPNKKCYNKMMPSASIVMFLKAYEK